MRTLLQHLRYGWRMLLHSPGFTAVAILMAMTLTGVVIGLIGAAGLSRLVSELLYEVRPADPATLAIVSVMLAAVAVAACYLPARQALKMDPMAALRKD